MNKPERQGQWLRMVCLSIALLLASRVGYAEPINAEKLANAIYKAEGGSHTRHPYGVLAHYRHTTPRAACLNTIKHQYAIYLRLKGQGKAIKGGFLCHLSRVYAPVGASNDPWNSNANWLSNVRYFYQRSE